MMDAGDARGAEGPEERMMDRGKQINVRSGSDLASITFKMFYITLTVLSLFLPDSELTQGSGGVTKCYVSLSLVDGLSHVFTVTGTECWLVPRYPSTGHCLTEAERPPVALAGAGCPHWQHTDTGQGCHSGCHQAQTHPHSSSEHMEHMEH